MRNSRMNTARSRPHRSSSSADAISCRGAEPHVAEGDPTTRRIVIVEFPTMERLKEWYASAEYAKALALRARALDRRFDVR